VPRHDVRASQTRANLGNSEGTLRAPLTSPARRRAAVGGTLQSFGAWRADGCGRYMSPARAWAPAGQKLPEGISRLRRAARLLAVLLSGVTAGCPSSTPPAAAGTATYFNALTGSVVVELGATSTAEGLRFSIQSLQGDYPALQFFAALPGTTLEAVTYDETNGTGATTLVEEAPAGGVTWRQASAENADAGSFSLVLTDAGESVAIDGGTGWPAPQGCLMASLVPVGTLTDAGVLVVVNAPSGVGCP
jgi:hypothetical protein